MRLARMVLTAAVCLTLVPSLAPARAELPAPGALGEIQPPMSFRWAPISGKHSKQYFEGNTSVKKGTTIHTTYFKKQGGQWKVLKNKAVKTTDQDGSFDVAFGLGIYKGKCGAGASLTKVEKPSLRFSCGKNLK